MPLEPAQLNDVRLARVEFEANPEFENSDAPNASYVVKANTTISEPEVGDDGEMWAVAAADVTIEWSRVDGGEGPLPFELDLRAVGVFSWEPATRPDDDRIARLWLDYNAQYLMWPYLRTFITTITAMSHLPPLTIYTMNVPRPPLIEETEEQTSAETSSADEAAQAGISDS